MKTEELKKMAHALLAVQESQFQYVVPEEIDAHERTAFHGAAAGAAKAGKSHFSFKGKKYPVTMKKDVATKIADSVEHDEEEVVEEGKLPPALQAYMDKKKGKKSKGKENEKDNDDDNDDDEDEKEVKEANAPKGTHTPNNGSPMGQGLSPSAKKEVDNKTPISQEIDEPTVDKLNFQKFRTMTKKSPMRSGDNAKGDTAIKPGGTPMKDPAAMKAESYVEESYTHEFDYAEDGKNTAKSFVAKAKKAGIKAKIHDPSGPGGGHPVVHLGHKDTKHMHSFLKKHYDPDMHHDDLDSHKI